MYKLSFIILFLTTPLSNSTPYAGLPLWAWTSLSMSVFYAFVLIFHIETHWDDNNAK